MSLSNKLMSDPKEELEVEPGRGDFTPLERTSQQ